jgi:hypothetical protein
MAAACFSLLHRSKECSICCFKTVLVGGSRRCGCPSKYCDSLTRLCKNHLLVWQFKCVTVLIYNTDTRISTSYSGINVYSEAFETCTKVFDPCKVYWLLSYVGNCLQFQQRCEFYPRSAFLSFTLYCAWNE